MIFSTFNVSVGHSIVLNLSSTRLKVPSDVYRWYNFLDKLTYTNYKVLKYFEFLYTTMMSNFSWVLTFSTNKYSQGTEMTGHQSRGSFNLRRLTSTKRQWISVCKWKLGLGGVFVTKTLEKRRRKTNCFIFTIK